VLNKASEGLSITQAAERLGVHHHTIRNWIKAGKLPATRFGDRIVRIDPEDLENLRQQA
jgi:excisionase family DNA binding protein